MNSDIVKKYREYLTKAQIRELAKRAELYKQTHAEQRAEALSEIRGEYDTARRGLQNMGLASRQGNLISGKEKGMRAPLMRQYTDYNRKLGEVEHTYTDREAARMANETIRARAAAARRRAEEEARKAEQERAEAEQAYRLKLEVNPRNKAVWSTAVTDSGTGTPSAPAAKDVSQTIQGVGGTAAARQQMFNNALNKAANKKVWETYSPLAPERASKVTRDKLSSYEGKINELSTIQYAFSS